MNALALFDYTSVPAEHQPTVREATARIRLRMSRTAEDIVEIGRDLIAVKAALGHGHFLKWIEAEFGMSRQTADNFVHVAERFDGKLPTIGNLAPTVLYALAAPSTPDEVRAEVTRRTSAGETVSLAEVKRLKDEWAAERGELRRQVEDARTKTRDAKSTTTDYSQQVADLQREVRELRDRNDTLQFELNRRGSDRGQGEPEPVERQVESLINDWNRLSPQAKRAFLKRINNGGGAA